MGGARRSLTGAAAEFGKRAEAHAIKPLTLGDLRSSCKFPTHLRPLKPPRPAPALNTQVGEARRALTGAAAEVGEKAEAQARAEAAAADLAQRLAEAEAERQVSLLAASPPARSPSRRGSARGRNQSGRAGAHARAEPGVGGASLSNRSS